MLGSFLCPILASNLVRPSLVTPPRDERERDKLQDEVPPNPAPTPPVLVCSGYLSPTPTLRPEEGPLPTPRPHLGPGHFSPLFCSDSLTIRHHHENGLRAKASAPAVGL